MRVRAPRAAVWLLEAPGGAGGFTGKLDISIAQDRPPRVERAEVSSPDLDLGVEAGMTLLSAAG